MDTPVGLKVTKRMEWKKPLHVVQGLLIMIYESNYKAKASLTLSAASLRITAETTFNPDSLMILAPSSAFVPWSLTMIGTEMSPIDFALTKDAFKELIAHEGQKATVLCVEVNGFYDIKFDDGYVVNAIDVYHLCTKIVEWYDIQTTIWKFCGWNF